MARETVGLPDWKRLDWQETPYPGVFLFRLDEEPDPANPNVPLSSMFAMKVNPNSSIPRHIHKRGPEWREKIVFGEPGNFEILRENGQERILNGLLVIVIKPYEVFGLNNHGAKPLYFTSSMKPGFTGYEEIEEVDIAR